MFNVLDELVVDLLCLFVEPDSLYPSDEEAVHQEQNTATGVPRSISILLVVGQDVRCLERNILLKMEVVMAVSNVNHQEIGFLSI